jgi:hypothetical protein
VNLKTSEILPLIPFVISDNTINQMSISETDKGIEIINVEKSAKDDGGEKLESYKFSKDFIKALKI